LEYKIDGALFNKLARTIKYDFRKVNRDATKFIDELPHNLKLDLSAVIHERMYESVEFLRGKQKTFLAWVGMILKPYSCQYKEYLYKEG
jgi:hypothetical protein